MVTNNEKKFCPILHAVGLIGTYEATGRVCGVSGKAVMKWVANGRLPRTEATGETEYAALLAAAHEGIDGDALLSTVMKRAVA